MAAKKEATTLAERSKERYAEADAKVKNIHAEQDKVSAALEEFAWEPGTSTLPLLDLERQRDMLASSAKTAERVLARAEENLWPSGQPDVAIAVVALLDGAFLDGAPATAYETDPGTEAERPEFRVVQDRAHRIERTGAVSGPVTISIVGPSWAKSLVDNSNKFAIVDYLHDAGVRFFNANGTREVANRWHASLTAEVGVHGQAPYVAQGEPSGRVDAQVTGAWAWRKFAVRGLKSTDGLGLGGSSYVPDVLAGGSQTITVAGSKLDGDVRTTTLDVYVNVAQPAIKDVPDVARAAVDAMAGRGIVAGIGRIHAIEVLGSEAYERKVNFGQGVVRGFTIHARATATGTVR